VQSDKLTREIVDLGDLVRKFAAFGWCVARCDGHDFEALDRSLDAVLDAERPGIIVADTIKGRGVSFMEHPAALLAGKGSYPWHAGAPADEAFESARRELLEGLRSRYLELGLGVLPTLALEPEFASTRPRVVQELAGEPVSPAAQERMATGVSDEYVAKAFGEALLDIGRRRPDLVVLDGDLAADCRVRDFELQLPSQFIENGIAEQDMVSVAAGLARHGLLPVVNSFASFLGSRANEQIYNAGSERSHIVYALHYAGLIPAGPGKSHQSLRDISLLSSLPGATVVQPCNAAETRQLLHYLVDGAKGICAMRLCIGPSPRRIALPDDYRIAPGRGVELTPGGDAIMFAYGPVMLHEALIAAELLGERGFGLSVVNMPWLTTFDDEWVFETLRPFERIYVLEDHAPVGGLADGLVWACLRSRTLDGTRTLRKIGIEGWPACGTPAQALQQHGVDGASLAERLLAEVGNRSGARG
jgi:transketolase